MREGTCLSIVNKKREIETGNSKIYTAAMASTAASCDGASVKERERESR